MREVLPRREDFHRRQLFQQLQTFCQRESFYWHCRNHVHVVPHIQLTNALERYRPRRRFKLSGLGKDLTDVRSVRRPDKKSLERRLLAQWSKSLNDFEIEVKKQAQSSKPKIKDRPITPLPLMYPFSTSQKIPLAPLDNSPYVDRLVPVCCSQK